MFTVIHPWLRMHVIEILLSGGSWRLLLKFFDLMEKHIYPSVAILWAWLSMGESP